MKIFKKNILYGGDILNENKQIQMFFSIIIIGYFGIKIIYGLFFNFYPYKYYQKNVQIISNDENNSNSENVIMNAFVPGLWNNEMTDFITMIVLGFIIYVFTNVSNKSIISQYGNLNMSFILGYVIGLGYPPIYINTKDYIDKIAFIKYFMYIFLIGFIFCVFVLNYSSANKISSEHKNNYIVYILSFILLIFGLFLTKKTSKNYSIVSYFNSSNDNCTFSKNGIIQTSGEQLKITIPFISLILILFFSYEPEQITIKSSYIFLYGLLLGIIVSGTSYFGIEYFLYKTPEKECNSANECIIKELPIPVNNTYNTLEEETEKVNIEMNIDSNLKYNLSNMFNFSKVSVINIILIIFIILVIIYLIFYYFTSI
jgi:hypothetical protein